jgi:hypothetical protein
MLLFSGLDSSNCSRWFVGCALSVSELGSGIHRQASGTTTKSVSFGSEFPSVTLLAENLSRMFTNIGGIKSLLAQTTGEAGLVPLVSSGDHFFGSIDGLSALSALGNIWGFERHDDLVIGFVRGWTLK